MLELGSLLAVAPAQLNSLVVSAVLLAIALGLTVLAARLTREGIWFLWRWRWKQAATCCNQWPSPPSAVC